MNLTNFNLATNDMHSREFLEKMKEQLLEEKERLTEELKDTQSHTEMGDDLDSAATEVEVDEVNQDIIAQLKSDLEKIDAALAKIENGTYGVCSIGGEDIPESRLEVLPWAETCIDHES